MTTVAQVKEHTRPQRKQGNVQQQVANEKVGRVNAAAAAEAPAEIPRDLVSQLASTWGALPAPKSAAPANKPAPVPTEEATSASQEAPLAAAPAPEVEIPLIPHAAVTPVTTAAFPPAAFPAEAPEVAIEPLPYLRNMPLASKPSSRVVPLEGPSDLAEADAIASQFSGSVTPKAMQTTEDAPEGVAQSPAHKAAPAHEAAEEETLARRARLHAEKHVRNS